MSDNSETNNISLNSDLGLLMSLAIWVKPDKVFEAIEIVYREYLETKYDNSKKLDINDLFEILSDKKILITN